MAQKKKEPVVKGTEVTVTVNSRTGKAGVLSPTAKARKERIKTAFGDGFLKDATKLYGSLVNLYKDIPELRKIMQDSFVNEDTPETFLTKVGSSKWAESRSKQQETDTAQKAADPVQYDRDLADWIARTQASVGKTGITISEDQIKEIATKAKQNGWSGDLFENYVGAEVIKYNNAAPAAGGVTQNYLAPTACEKYPATTALTHLLLMSRHGLKVLFLAQRQKNSGQTSRRMLQKRCTPQSQTGSMEKHSKTL